MPSDEAKERENRRKRRAQLEVRVFGPGEDEAMADYDALYWDRIPWNERAEFVWQLSTEVWKIAHPDDERDLNEPGLSRSVARVLES